MKTQTQDNIGRKQTRAQREVAGKTQHASGACRATQACGVAMLLASLMAGCASSHPTTTESNAPVIQHTPIAGKDNADRLAGLLLMHGVLDKQRDLDKVVDIPFKDVRPEVETLLTAITNASIRADDQVKSLINASGGDPDKSKTVLPLLEIQSRDGIESITTKEIIFGNSKEMEFNLLYNQLQSCRYMSQLALAASNISKGQDQTALKGISDEFTKLYNQTFQLMIKAYKP